MFLDPILEIISEMLAYADDSYIYAEGSTIEEVELQLTDRASQIMKWLEMNGMIINKNKTEYIVFGKQKLNSKLELNGQTVESTDGIKVLGLKFDSQLTWGPQIESTISKAKSSCYGLNHLRKFFEQEDMIKIATSLAYSRFYYGATVWYGPMTHKNYKKRLKSASTGIIKSALGLHDWTISYDDLHQLAGRGTPDQFSHYQHAISLYDIINNEIPTPIWLEILSKTLTNERNDSIIIPGTNWTRIALNSLDNRLSCVSNKLTMTQFNAPKSSFKTCNEKSNRFKKQWRNNHPTSRQNRGPCNF